MKKIALFTVAFLGMVAHADTSAMDAHSADQMTTQTRSVNYICQGNKKLTVKYGFDEHEAATFAQASVNGKKRFMPINRNLSDEVGTTFGDENNFNLTADRLDLTNYRNVKLVGIMSPSGEFAYKGCAPQKQKKTSKKSKKR